MNDEVNFKAEGAGPAFPRPCSSVTDVNGVRHFAPAFPGMSLRDWFAGQALAGMCTSAGYQGLPWDAVSSEAYAAADAMIAERVKASKP